MEIGMNYPSRSNLGGAIASEGGRQGYFGGRIFIHFLHPMKKGLYKNKANWENRIVACEQRKGRVQTMIRMDRKWAFSLFLLLAEIFEVNIEKQEVQDAVRRIEKNDEKDGRKGSCVSMRAFLGSH